MEILHYDLFKSYLQPRPQDWHKGLSGRVLIIGGNIGLSGAAALAAKAALRVGAGLVNVVTHPVNAISMNALIPEIMCLGIEHEQQLQPLFAKATVVVVGPGLGQCDWAKSMWLQACEFSGPLIMDADALNLLAKLQELPQLGNRIFTPHPAEASRLLQSDVATIQQDRIKAIRALVENYGGTWILKGAGTLIKSDKCDIAQCSAGNPGMATGGMGDVLTGVIAGLAAQQIPLLVAAKLGVLLHAMAGDLAAVEGARGMIASDLFPYLRQLVNVK